MKSTGDTAIDALYRGRRGRVDFVDVPELGFVVVDGRGAPGGEEFTQALQALFSVTYAAHFQVKKTGGEAPRVMPLEALWWEDGARWRWRAMIVQLPPVDAAVVAAAIDEAGSKRPLQALPRLRFERWREGRSAQIMHVGPYADEAPSVAALHAAIAERGLRPRGHHHEIYLGDPRTAAPERLRTILRQPVE